MMNTQTRTYPINAIKADYPSLYQVLRAHSLGELYMMSPAELTAARIVVTGKIVEIENRIRTTNLFFSQINELRSDVRWYTKISADITTLLMTGFHANS